MKLLYIGDSYQGDDSSDFLSNLIRLPTLRGHQVVTSFAGRNNATEVAFLAKKHNVDAVICSQQTVVEAALRALPDYTPPDTRKGITLNDYAGSWIDLPYDIPMIVINNLERLFSVPYEKFITNRYISKLTNPEVWWNETKFQWKQVFEHTATEILQDLETADLLAVDIETLREDRRIELCGYAAYNFDTGESRCYVVHVNSEWAWRFVQKANKTRAAKIFQNGQYDNCYFARWNAPVYNWMWDTMTLMHCWYSEFPKKLSFVAAFALRKSRYWKDDGVGSMENKMRYNALDCWATLNSMLSMVKEMPVWARDNYYQEFPMNFPSITAALESWKVDTAEFMRVKAQKEAEAETVLARIRYLLSAPKFNPRSPPQMSQLFTLLGCVRTKRDSNAAAFMLKARATSPFNDMLLGLIVEYKKAAKLVSSYLDDSKLWNGRWYYSINPAATDTGRSGSSESAFWCGDSIQVIPRGDTIKNFFVADEGWLLAEPDKAQSEARCVGYMSGETKLINLVESTHDYHSWNAAAFFGVPYEQIYDESSGDTLDTDLRDLSKRTNHGANYNMGDAVMLDTMGPKKVAFAKLKLKLPAHLRLTAVCQFLLDRYSETYPRVKGLFYDTIISTIERTNKLVSPYGWTRYFFAKPSKKNKPALNAAVAHGPQNLSVSIINREWYAIWRSTVHGNLRGRVRVKAQIHDSLPFQYRKDDIAAAVEVVNMMQTATPVTGADGVTRTMVIPAGVKLGAVQWSKLKSYRIEKQ